MPVRINSQPSSHWLRVRLTTSRHCIRSRTEPIICRSGGFVQDRHRSKSSRASIFPHRSPKFVCLTEQAVTAETLSGPATFSVVRSGTSFTEAVDVFYTVHGNAQSGTDYTPLTGVVTILPGQSTAIISVVPVAMQIRKGTNRLRSSFGTGQDID